MREMTDLRIYRSPLPPPLPALQEALYSEKLRGFMREVTGCGELSDKIDCSCNVYADGGHLLCHDDVIGGFGFQGGRELAAAAASNHTCYLLLLLCRHPARVLDCLPD